MDRAKTRPFQTESRMEGLRILSPQALAIVKGDTLDNQGTRILVDQKLRSGWADFKAFRDRKRGKRLEETMH